MIMMRAFSRRWRKGDIILWYGAVADIRKGWALCDGNNGTPDLNGRSVIGAGGSFAVGDRGGVTSHTHAFTSNTHAHSINYTGPFVGELGGNLRAMTNNVAVLGTTDSKSTRSPYHALCFIMKL